MDKFKNFQAGIAYHRAYSTLIARMEQYKPEMTRKHYNELLSCIRDFALKADEVLEMAAELERKPHDRVP